MNQRLFPNVSFCKTAEDRKTARHGHHSGAVADHEKAASPHCSLGNERADSLAEEGRVSSPLCLVLSLPERPVLNLELPSTPTPRRAPAVPRSIEITHVIIPCLESPALSSPRQMQRNSEHDNIQPKSLEFSAIEVSCSHSGSSPSGTISTNDTASTVSIGRSSDSDDPDQVWATLGLTAIATLAPPARRRRLNTPSTDASSPCPRQSDNLSISSGCHTPASDSD